MVSSDLRGVWGFDYTSMFAFKFPRVLLKKVQKATFILFLCGADAILSLVLFVIINRKQSRCYYAQKGVIIGKFVRLVRKNNIEVWCGLGPTKRGHRGVSEDGRKRVWEYVLRVEFGRAWVWAHSHLWGARVSSWALALFRSGGG